ncbi:MAG: hypothetical protein HC799_07555 [Limnothrix sp. RL_2_0]|nr:hypothetical protein [Limnothrix sp. RL_2_0]
MVYSQKGDRALLILGAGFGLNPLRLFLADYFFSKAETYYMDGLGPEAIALYDRSLFLNPHNSQGHFGKAFICDEQTDHVCAEKHYTKVLSGSSDRRSEEHIFSTNNLALIHIQQDRNLQAAITNLQTILPFAQKINKEGFIYKNLALGYLAAKDLAQGIIHFDQAKKTLKEHPDFDCIQTLINEAEATGEIPPITHCFDTPD